MNGGSCMKQTIDNAVLPEPAFITYDPKDLCGANMMLHP